ncbi:MAG TPA: hypothetical protein VHG35_06580 [Gemmatimonadales bacterium]|nr:hypothetical protein [Gemmatimonadales bacterium]
MSDRDDVPPELADMDRALRGVVFQPRASLGPEVLGRMRRGERPMGSVPRRPRGPALAAATAALLLVIGAALALRAPPAAMVDRCCYDLDGGGDLDDGVVVLAERDAKVHQLLIYEDLDDSRSYTPGDLVRLDRGSSPAMHQVAAAGLVTIEHCCLDFDGGGPADDGLVVIGVPPDRVVMAAIYERPADARPRPAGSGGFPLR